MSLVKLAYSEYYTPEHAKLDKQWIAYTKDRYENYEKPMSKIRRTKSGVGKSALIGGATGALVGAAAAGLLGKAVGFDWGAPAAKGLLLGAGIGSIVGAAKKNSNIYKEIHQENPNLTSHLKRLDNRELELARQYDVVDNLVDQRHYQKEWRNL